MIKMCLSLPWDFQIFHLHHHHRRSGLPTPTEENNRNGISDGADAARGAWM